MTVRCAECTAYQAPIVGILRAAAAANVDLEADDLSSGLERLPEARRQAALLWPPEQWHEFLYGEEGDSERATFEAGK
jgi:hypothetical protein